MTSNPSRSIRKNSKADWVLHASSVLLEVMEKAPFPYLKDAASMANAILKVAQNVRDNKTGFQKAAGHCAQLIETIWSSYQASSDKKHWPSADLVSAIKNLAKELSLIRDSLEKELGKGIGSRIVRYKSDGDRIQAIREDLDQALRNFNLASNLNNTAVLSEVLKNSTEILGAVRPARNDDMLTLEDPQEETAGIHPGTPAALPSLTAAVGPNQGVLTVDPTSAPQSQHPQLDILAQLHTQLGQNPGLNSPSPLVPFALHNPTAFHPGLWPMAPFYPFNFAQTSSDTAGSNQGAASATGIIANCGNITSSGNVINSGNVRNTGHGNIVGCGNIKNAGIGTVANSGNVSNSGNIFGSGNISAPGNIMYSGNITGSGNISNSGNISTFAAPFGYHFNPPNVPPVSS